MPVDNNSTAANPGSRLRELGLVLPKPPTPLGAYVEASKSSRRKEKKKEKPSKERI